MGLDMDGCASGTDVFGNALWASVSAPPGRVLGVGGSQVSGALLEFRSAFGGGDRRALGTNA